LFVLGPLTTFNRPDTIGSQISVQQRRHGRYILQYLYIRRCAEVGRVDGSRIGPKILNRLLPASRCGQHSGEYEDCGVENCGVRKGKSSQSINCEKLLRSLARGWGSTTVLLDVGQARQGQVFPKFSQPPPADFAHHSTNEQGSPHQSSSSFPSPFKPPPQNLNSLRIPSLAMSTQSALLQLFIPRSLLFGDR
jgi:hypothetical protein